VIAWMWKFLEGAKTAGELYGRAGRDRRRAARQSPRAGRQPARSPQPLVIAERHRGEALRKLAGRHLPASLTALERTVERAHAAYDEAEQAQRRQPRENAVADIDATPQA